MFPPRSGRSLPGPEFQETLASPHGVALFDIIVGGSLRIVKSFAVGRFWVAGALAAFLLAPGGTVRAVDAHDASPKLPGYPITVSNLAEYQARTRTGPYAVGPRAGYVSPQGGPVALPSAIPAEYAERGVVPDPFEISRRVPDPDTIDLTGRDLTSKRCLSIGAPNRGRLVNGIPLEPFPGLLVRPSVHHVYGTPETIAALHYAVARVHKLFPGAHDLVVGDLSRKGGGRLPPHVSHQSGRDVDIGYYHRNIDAPRSFVNANAANLDLERTWAFVEALLDDHKVEYIFMDYAVQRLLYNYVKYRLGAPESYLEMVFAYPRRSHTAFIRHEVKHRDHMHIRFWSPIAVAASRGVRLSPKHGRWFTPDEIKAYTRGGYVALSRFDRVDWVRPEIQRGRERYATYRVRPGDTLSGIARRHQVSTASLMMMNHLNSRSIIRPGQQLLLPILKVDTRPGPAVAANRRVQPAAGGEALARCVSFSTDQTLYRVVAGDYPGKIAKRFGVPVDRLLAANGLDRKTRIYPGQRLVIPVPYSGAVAMGDGAAKAGACATTDDTRGTGEDTGPEYRVVKRESWVTVAQGDSLWSIARRHGTTVDRLCRLNGLRRDSVLQVGQRLKAAEWYDRVPVRPRPVLTSQPEPEVLER